MSFDLLSILPMFGAVYKKLHFSRQKVENVSLTLPRFSCRANWDSKLRSETTLVLLFDVKNPMAVSNLINELLLEIMFFDVSLFVLIYVKLQ